MRFCYEVYARLCATGEHTIGDWLLRTQLNNACYVWELALYQVHNGCDDRTLCNVSYSHRKSGLPAFGIGDVYIIQYLCFLVEQVLSVVLKSVGALFLLSSKSNHVIITNLYLL